MGIHSHWNDPDDFGECWNEEPSAQLDLEQYARLKEALDPDEAVLWAERAALPAPPTVAAFPAFFTAVLCGLSGFALMLLFGIYGQLALSPFQMLFYAGLAPAALGSVIVLGMSGRWARFRQLRSRLARTFYALTDGRALIATERSWDEPLAFWSVTSEMFDDTLCIEQPPGPGDVFFVAGGVVIEPELGFVGLCRPRHVETLLRRVLLGLGPKSGSDSPASQSDRFTFWAND
jgi:hypothetical protein